MRSLMIAAAFTASLLGTARAEETIELPSYKWSFSGPLGSMDLASAQRGFQVYREVCSSCHGMHLVHFRDLAGIGLSQEQIANAAASVETAGPIDDNGQPTTRPGLPSDILRSPYANDKAAQAANGGAIPPDQSLILNAREDGANYIKALLMGYSEPPAGMKVADGLYYNKIYPGHQIHMPQPLRDEQVTYTDGTKATLDQETTDIVTFLNWASNPEMVQRKQMGVRIVLFLMLMTGLTYTLKKKIWADVH